MPSACSNRLSAAGLRVELDDRQEKINYKIREAQLQKVPYMLVAGDRESADGTVAVRSRSGGDLGARPVDAFIADALEEVRREKPEGEQEAGSGPVGLQSVARGGRYRIRSLAQT